MSTILVDAIGGAIGSLTAAQMWVSDLHHDADESCDFDMADELKLVFESLGRTAAELREALTEWANDH